MAINITIKKEAYDALTARKRSGMSYSDVILSLTQPDAKNPQSVFGILKEKNIKYDYGELEKVKARFRR